MRIKWQDDTWTVKYYPDSYARWTLENGNTSVSWLVTEENNFSTQEEFIQFLRERKEEMGNLKDELLNWIVEIAEARLANVTARQKTVEMKSTHATLRMWVDRVRNVLSKEE